jgi:hypothetical protein
MFSKYLSFLGSVVDPHHLDADPKSTYHPDADPDYNFLFYADPDAVPDPTFMGIRNRISAASGRFSAPPKHRYYLDVPKPCT